MLAAFFYFGRWVSKDELLVTPAYEPDGIDPMRDYRVAMLPDLCWQMARRGEDLRGVEAGPG